MIKIIAYISNTTLFVWLLCCSCKSGKKDHPALFEKMTGTGVEFINKVEDGKIENSFYFRNFYNGGGVALGDVNNDGYADIFLTSNTADNKLYLNKGKKSDGTASWEFTDITAGSGMKQDGMWSTGAVFADVNADGWLDIYVCNSGQMKTGNRRNKLYINNKDLSFTESASQYGLAISAYTTQVSFFDYDLDGDLDCFMINNSPIPFSSLNYANMRDKPEKEWKVDANLKGGGNKLFRNDNNFFTEVTQSTGIHTSLISFGLGVSVGDVNGDDYPDVYIGNDFIERDYLYINQKNGTFKDELEDRVEHISMSSMSTDLADINNDGFPEIFTTDMLPEDDYRLKTMGTFDNVDLYRSKLKAGFYQQFVRNALQLNNKNGTFCEISNYSGVAASDWSWAGLLFDADNDGFNDIYVCNGVNRDLGNLDFLDFFSNEVYKKMVETGQQEEVYEILKKIPINAMPNKAYRNLGDLRFSDAGEAWGFGEPSFSNGAAYGDLDNDGDLDLVINNENQPAFVYQNHSRSVNGHHYISVKLQGSGKNTFGIGAKVRVYRDSVVYYREQVPSRGFQSSVDYQLVIGLGSAEKVDSMVVSWPDGSRSVYRSPGVDQLYVVRQSEAVKGNIGQEQSTISPQGLLLEAVESGFVKHQEDDHVDFYYERNIPELLSRQGPKSAVGDVNADGLEDIYIGGAAGQGGQLYVQNKSGGFERSLQKGLEGYTDFEEVAVLFFDSDGDRDLDLFIGSGGNHRTGASRELQHRLYRNDGKGGFTLDVSAFPGNESNTGVAIAEDFDGDGDQDLFVGSRSLPQQYGVSPLSYVYVNDGKGRFRDLAAVHNKEISSIGMVTGAVWSDVSGDGKRELVIVGEWMSPRIFSWSKDRFVEVKSNLQGMQGWWQTVVSGDVNGDGRQDLVLGNLGENFYLHPRQESPVRLWMKDFDQNGSIDKVLTRSIEGRDMPVFLKQEMQEQLPVLKKQNLRHEQFARKSIQELFSAEMMKGAVVREFNYASSCVAINEGEGKFKVERMATAVQLSSVNAVRLTDINGDGRLDMIVGGNQFGYPPQFGRLDGSYGEVLVNSGNGMFRREEASRTGLKVTGEVRDIAEVKGGTNRYILVLRNDNYPALYRLK